jgi:hypothetical protein
MCSLRGRGWRFWLRWLFNLLGVLSLATGLSGRDVLHAVWPHWQTDLGGNTGRWMLVLVALALFVFANVGPLRRRPKDKITPSPDAPLRPPELLASYQLLVLPEGFYFMKLKIDSTLPANLVDPLVRVSVPRDATLFRPCDHNGTAQVLGDVRQEGEHWLWTYEPHLVRANTSTYFYFHLDRDRKLGAIPVTVEVVHLDLPGGTWEHQAALGLPVDVHDPGLIASAPATREIAASLVAEANPPEQEQASQQDDELRGFCSKARELIERGEALRRRLAIGKGLSSPPPIRSEIGKWSTEVTDCFKSHDLPTRYHMLAGLKIAGWTSAFGSLEALKKELDSNLELLRDAVTEVCS